jgi:hypothetical protein
LPFFCSSRLPLSLFPLSPILASFRFKKLFYPIITHSSSYGPKIPYVRCMVLANKVFFPSMILPRMTKAAIPGRI